MEQCDRKCKYTIKWDCLTRHNIYFTGAILIAKLYFRQLFLVDWDQLQFVGTCEQGIIEGSKGYFHELPIASFTSREV